MIKKTKFRVVVEQGTTESFHYCESLASAYLLVYTYAKSHLDLYWCIQYSERRFDGPIKHIARGRSSVCEIES